MLAVLREDVAVTAGQDHRHVGVTAPDLAAEIDAAQTRHYHVGEHDVISAAILLQLGERLVGVGRENAVVAQLLAPGSRTRRPAHCPRRRARNILRH